MPSKTRPSVLLKSVARRILGSSGLIQKGRSRIWLADQVWRMMVGPRLADDQSDPFFNSPVEKLKGIADETLLLRLRIRQRVADPRLD